MKKYFFVAFNALNKGYIIGCGWFVISCSCCFGRMCEAILNCYNKNAPQKADSITITSLTVLDKQTAAQLSNNFTNSSLIIDDGDKEEEKEVEVDAWLARYSNGDLWIYVCKNKPTKEDCYWHCDEDADCMEIDGKFFHEVQWSDEEPTKVRLVIDK